MDQAQTVAAVEDAILRRKTEKVLGDPDAPVAIPDDLAARNREIVLGSLKTAGWAPFHYPRNVDGLAEPWRAHVVWHEDARRLALFLRDELGVTSKEPNLAAGCGALVLATWLPESPEDAPSATPEKLASRNEEHLMAASAMVQNLMLLLTAHGMGTYWSSGGALRQPETFARLGIPTNQRLMAALFIEYPAALDGSEDRKPGAHREKRGAGWVRETSL